MYSMRVPEFRRSAQAVAKTLVEVDAGERREVYLTVRRRGWICSNEVVN
jgi:hypothetical protein